MPLFSSRPKATGIDAILQTIDKGECDDHTIKQLQEYIEAMSIDDVRSLADVLMTNLVKYPDDIDVLTGSVKALEALPFMPKAKNEFIITLLLSLLKAPVNKKDALQRKALKSEVVKFLLFFVVEDDTYARLMMAELISAMDDTHGSISSSVFHSLQRLAVEKPEYFERHSAALIKQLGSISKSTRAEAAKLIGIIAKTHPEYVSKAMPFLQSLASFYPDAHVKRNSNEAYQVILRSMKKEAQAPVVVRKVDPEGKGFADIVKLNSGPSNGGVAEVQFTDDELKDIIELTRKEFKSDAEAILNSLGVGHLTVKSKDTRKKAPLPKAAEPVKAKREEKVFVAPQSGIASVMRREEKETEAPKASRQKATIPEAAPASVKAKRDESTFVAPQPGIAHAINREEKGVEAPKVPMPEPAPVPVKAKREEKVFVAPQSGIASAMRREEKAAPKVLRPKAMSPETAPVLSARPKREEKPYVAPQSGIVDALMKDINTSDVAVKPAKAKGDSKAGRIFKCPKCGKHVWAEGQLCNSCGAEEFDAMRVKGHYDIG